MNKRFYSIKTKNPKLIASFYLLFFALIFQNSLVAQTTLYSESMDNGTGGSNGDAISVHQTNGRFQEAGLTYSGTGDMRNTLPSSGYGTASGGFNAFLNSTGETFIIDGLDLTTCLSNIVLSFGVNKSTNLSDGSRLSLQYSTTGVAGPYVTIDFPLLPTGSGTATGYYYVSTTSTIPSDVTTLRFAATDGTAYRIDDILISCNTTTCVPPTFITQPIDKSICETEGFQLYAPADGTGTITYQWQVDMGSGFVDLADDATYTGSAEDTLIAINAIGSMDGYKYRCIATEGACADTSNTSTLNIDAVPTPTITAGGPTTFCQGGSVVLTSSSTSGNLWDNQAGSTTQSIIVNQSGDYTVKVTVGLCSKNSAPTTVIVENANFSIGAINHPTLCGTPDGEIELLGNQAGDVSYRTYSDFYPTDPLIPSVTQPATLTYSLNGLIRGNWEITFTTPLGCVFKDSVLLTADLPVPTITAGINTLTPDYRAQFCAPDSIELISSSDMNNTWQRLSNGTWTDFATTQTIIVNTTDTVRVSVTSGPCTEFSDTAFILVNRQPVISVNSFLNPTSCGAFDGSIEILGDTTGTLTWSGPVNGSSNVDLETAPNTFDITALSAGLYKIYMNDGTCTSDTITQSLNDPGAPTTPVITPSGPTTFCVGSSVDLTIPVDPDVLVVNTWYNGATVVQNGGTSYTATTSGTYSVTATKLTCVSSSAPQIVTVNPYPAVPTISSSDSNDSICTGTSLTLTSTLGAAYLWSPNNETTRSITVTAGGDYTVSVTENGCTSTSIIRTISENDSTTLVFGTVNNPSICGSADATAQILDLKESDENTGDLTWTGPTSGSATGMSLSFVMTSLSSGTYDVTINTPLGCIGYAQLNIVDPITVPTISLATNDTVDFCKGGDVTLISSSSVGNQWTWNGNPIAGATGQTFTTDSSGVYAVEVTIGTCTTASLDTVVTAIPLPVISAGTLSSPTQCGFQDGVIEIMGSGTGDLSWTGRMTGDSIGLDFTANVNIDSLFAGDYIFTFDNGTCTSLPLNVTLNESSVPATPTVTASGATTFCNDNGANSVTLTASFTSGSYRWSNGVTGVDNITVNQSSNYYVVVTEGACSDSSDVINVTVINNPLAPTIVANGATTFCDGGSVVLTASTATGILWSTTEITQSITVSDPMSVTAIIQENGCDSDPSNTITIVENPIPVIALGLATDPTTCSGTDGSILISGTATGNLTWSGQMTGSVSGTLPLTASNLTAGTYTFTFNDGNCPSNIVTTTLSDPSSPATPTITAVGGAPVEFCQGGSVTLRSSASSGNSWNTIPAVTTRDLVVTQSGTYFVTVTNASMCSSVSAPITVTVNPIPASPTIIAQGATTFCTGGSVNLAASVGNGVLWSNNSTNQTITVNTTGCFTVTITENGCTSAPSAATCVTVNPNPPVPVISSSNGTSFDFCEGGSLQLTSSAASGNVWSNSTVSAPQVSQSQTVNSNGTYSVTVTNNGCSSTSLPVDVIEKNTPVATLPPYNQLCDTLDPFTLNQGVASDFTVGVGITTGYTVNGTAASTFDPADGPGTYNVVFTVTEDGCSDTDSQTITVVDCQPVTADINENSTSSFMVYPNPTSSEITITGDKLNHINQILVIDGLGRTVLTQDVSSTTIKIDMSSLANGTYSLVIKEDNSFISIERVQVSK